MEAARRLTACSRPRAKEGIKVAAIFSIFAGFFFYIIKIGASFFYIFAGTFFHIIKVATIFFIFAGYFFYIIKVGANFLCLLDTFLYYQGAVLFLEFPS